MPTQKNLPKFDERMVWGKSVISEQLWNQALVNQFMRESVFRPLMPPFPPAPWYRRLFNRWRYRFGVLHDAWNLIRENW
jgi:hypothetical protein